jgi:hypothetical protein
VAVASQPLGEFSLVGVASEQPQPHLTPQPRETEQQF